MATRWSACNLAQGTEKRWTYHPTHRTKGAPLHAALAHGHKKGFEKVEAFLRSYQRLTSIGFNDKCK
jgi:hypothetical protein